MIWLLVVEFKIFGVSASLIKIGVVGKKINIEQRKWNVINKLIKTMSSDGYQENKNCLVNMEIKQNILIQKVEVPPKTDGHLPEEGDGAIAPPSIPKHTPKEGKEKNLSKQTRFSNTRNQVVLLSDAKQTF